MKNISLSNLPVIFSIIVFLIFSGCNMKKNIGDPAYIKSIEEWRSKRIEDLKKDNGWLNLVGLYWLKEGKNKFGTDPSNDIVFPKGKAPAFIGSFYLQNDSVTVKINNGIDVTNNNKTVKEMTLKNDLSGDPTILALGPLRWFIIKRSDEIGVRLRNLDAPLVKKLKTINTYPIDENWKVTAKLSPYNPPKIITVPSIIGTKEQDTVDAALEFKLRGKTFRLDPLIEGNEYFIIFADKTSGKETYGGGRFLYAPLADSTGKTVLDFNKAYDPPCAFTGFATCPLPPKQNYMHIKVTAGEKVYHREN